MGKMTKREFAVKHGSFKNAEIITPCDCKNEKCNGWQVKDRAPSEELSVSLNKK
jgi:hypothetical protein